MNLQVQDLSYLVTSMGNDPFSKRYRKLSQGLCEVQPALCHLLWRGAWSRQLHAIVLVT